LQETQEILDLNDIVIISGTTLLADPQEESRTFLLVLKQKSIFNTINVVDALSFFRSQA
jgi:hypothetical protein